MPIAEDDPRLVFVSEESATTLGMIEHIKNNWWVVHPTKGLVFFDFQGHVAAQCNSDEAVTRRVAERLYPWATVKLIPSVF